MARSPGGRCGINPECQRAATFAQGGAEIAFRAGDLHSEEMLLRDSLKSSKKSASGLSLRPKL
jgi:hypothetical protein